MASDRVVVYTPVLEPAASQVDMLVLGMQYWWADKIVALGGDAASAVQAEPHPEFPSMKQVGAGKHWDTKTMRAQLIESGRFGLTSAFVPGLRGSAKLRHARLVEARRGKPCVRTLGKWVFNGGEADAAASAYEVLVSITRLLGLAVPYDGWEEALRTDDPVVAALYLRVLGYVSALRSNVVLPDPLGAFDLANEALRREPDMGPLLDGMPGLVDSLRSQPMTTPSAVESRFVELFELVGDPPASWVGGGRSGLH